MRLMQMNGILLFKLCQLCLKAVLLFEPAEDILQSCRYIEIDLLQSDFLVLL